MTIFVANAQAIIELSETGTMLLKKKKDFDGYVLHEEVLGGFLPYFVNNPINVNLLPIHNF